ncbi:MAG: S9 family peptidase, partial [Gemmatimonadetes bacterium]|nr:S9 family peptidase [Gemmatimonadota bacterium]NIR80948.1 S9 family peptidase [Gemmatimonadota bacterium]NIT86537.1 S9 family peptidase [Gemmatimonadota bacterium]NIU30399.1 S9 family peptidase [Gemmatimonadota bacterium]NIU35454.1 S9 family peptidase [Gemmatimonadota bacterium]
MPRVAVLLVAVALLASGAPSSAGSQEPPTLTLEDYGRWEDPGPPALSPDGGWLAVEIRRVNGEDELRIRRVGSDSLVAVPYGREPVFSPEGPWLAFSVGRSEEERERLEERDGPARDRLGLMDLVTGDTTLVEAVRSFAFSEDGPWLAMRGYGPEDGEGRAASLVIRDLRTGVDTRFGDVSEFAWQDDGGLLAMVVDGGEGPGSGVQLYDPGSGSLRTLISEDGRYRRLSWRKDADDLAVLRARGDEGHEDSTHVAIAWTGLAFGRPGPAVLDPAAAPGFPEGMRVTAYRAPEWSADGSVLFLGIREWEESPPDEASDTAAVEGADTARAEAPDSADAGEADGEAEEKPTVEIWHSRDTRIVPEQKVRETELEHRTYLSAWHIGTGRFVRLARHLDETVTPIEGTGRALVENPVPHDTVAMFGPRWVDLALVDVTTGERTPVARQIQYVYGASPGGRYVLWLRDDHYHAFDALRGDTANLTAELPTSVVDLDFDRTVDQKPPYGIAGWLRDDRALLVYDEYDVWRVAPDGSGGWRLTAGAEDTIRHRWVDLRDPEPADREPGIDPDGPLYLDLYHEWRELHGYGRMDDLASLTRRLVWAEAMVGGLDRADATDTYVYRVEDFEDSPDYFVGGPALADARQVTRTNPFQSEYAWGRSELVEFSSARGRRLQGALFYPAGYREGRSYPMITYICETRSPRVRRYVVPSERRYYDITSWTQEGYFVYQPDIVYRDRNPGLSAAEAIVPGVEAVLEARPEVDPLRVGLVGHSWGG